MMINFLLDLGLVIFFILDFMSSMSFTKGLFSRPTLLSGKNVLEMGQGGKSCLKMTRFKSRFHKSEHLMLDGNDAKLLPVPPTYLCNGGRIASSKVGNKMLGFYLSFLFMRDGAHYQLIVSDVASKQNNEVENLDMFKTRLTASSLLY